MTVPRDNFVFIKRLPLGIENENIKDCKLADQRYFWIISSEAKTPSL